MSQNAPFVPRLLSSSLRSPTRLRTKKILATCFCGLAWSTAAGALACGSSKKADESQPKAKASLEEDALEKALAEKREARKKKKAAEEAEANALAEKIDKLTSLPNKLPTKLAKACDLAVENYDGFMNRNLSGDGLKKWKEGGSATTLKTFKDGCMKGSIESAACQAHALEQFPQELARELHNVMGKCTEKFKNGVPAAG